MQKFLVNKVNLNFLLTRIDLFKFKSVRLSWNIFLSKFVYGYRKNLKLFFFDFFSIIFFLRRSLNFIESIARLNLTIFCYSPKFVGKSKSFKNFYFFKKWVKGFLTSFLFLESLQVSSLPSAVISLNTKKYNEIFISEAFNLNIPIVGLFDISSLNFNLFSYLIPSSLTLNSQLFYLRLFLKAYLIGYKTYLLRFLSEFKVASNLIKNRQKKGRYRVSFLKNVLSWKIKFKPFLRKLLRGSSKKGSLFSHLRKGFSRVFKRSLRSFSKKLNYREYYTYKRRIKQLNKKREALIRNSAYKFKVYLLNPSTSIFRNKFIDNFKDLSRINLSRQFIVLLDKEKKQKKTMKKNRFLFFSFSTREFKPTFFDVGELNDDNTLYTRRVDRSRKSLDFIYNGSLYFKGGSFDRRVEAVKNREFRSFCFNYKIFKLFWSGFSFNTFLNQNFVFALRNYSFFFLKKKKKGLFRCYFFFYKFSYYFFKRFFFLIQNTFYKFICLKFINTSRVVYNFLFCNLRDFEKELLNLILKFKFNFLPFKLFSSLFSVLQTFIYLLKEGYVIGGNFSLILSLFYKFLYYIIFFSKIFKFKLIKKFYFFKDFGRFLKDSLLLFRFNVNVNFKIRFLKFLLTTIRFRYSLNVI